MKRLDPQTFWESIPSEDSPVWPVICVDLNGVLDQYSGWNGKVEHHPLNPGAKAFLLRLREHFNTVVVLTATMPLEHAIEWLVEVGLDSYVDYVTSHKVPAAVYVDDRAVTFKGNFAETLEEVIHFIPYWKETNET